MKEKDKRTVMLHTVLLVLVKLTSYSQAAHILFYSPMTSFSHRIAIWPLADQLSENGHNVTIFATSTPKIFNPNSKVSEFSPKEIAYQDRAQDAFDGIAMRIKGSQKSDMWEDLIPYTYGLCKTILTSQETQDWIRRSHFDLVIIDGCMNDCGLGLAYKFKANVIIFGTTSMYMWHYDFFGILPETSWIPDIQEYPPQQMSFFQRVQNTLSPLLWYSTWLKTMLPQLEELMKETLDLPNMPSLAELERNTSLMFLNTHYSEEFARSLPPFVVPVGGLHINDKREPLPQEIANFIEEKNSPGFIYVSFGSFVKMSNLPLELREMFFQTFKAFSSYKFLCKWDGEKPDDLPDNTFLYSWMPQQDILAHPKIRAFISHGGLLGIQDSIYHGVPMIVLPVYADQDYNAERIHRGEHGIRLEVVGLTQTELQNAVTRILTDAKYQVNMKIVSALFKDRPAKPLETAVWWTEYVLRHGNNTRLLKPLSTQQYWYQRRLLDVWAFLLAISYLLGAIVLVIAFKLYSKIFKSKSKLPKKKLKSK